MHTQRTDSTLANPQSFTNYKHTGTHALDWTHTHTQTLKCSLNINAHNINDDMHVILIKQYNYFLCNSLQQKS